MQKPLAIFLAFLIFTASLIPKLDIEEIAKVPRLVHHFYEHVQASEKLNFFDFLSEHYQTKHKDDPEHQNLPFVNHQCCSVVFVLSEIRIGFLKVLVPADRPFVFFKIHYFFVSVKALFQPPKF